MHSSNSLLFVCVFGFLLNGCLGAETSNVNAAEKSSNTTAVVSDQKPAASAPANYYTVPSFLPGKFASNSLYPAADAILPTFKCENEFSDYWRSGFGQTLAYGGIIVSSLAILGGLAWLFAPFFGLKMCHLLGNCEKSAVTYSNGGNLQDPSIQTNGYSDMNQYVYPGPYNVAAYQKR